MSLQQMLSQLELRAIEDLNEREQFRLLDIRNQPLIRESSYTTHVIGEAEHRRWLESVRANEKRHFYGVLYNETLVGGVGLQQDKDPKSGEWSFYVSQDAQGKGLGLGLAVCALDLFFENLRLEEIFGEALVANEASLQFHKKIGFVHTANRKRQLSPANEVVEAACFKISKAEWGVARSGLISG